MAEELEGEMTVAGGEAALSGGEVKARRTRRKPDKPDGRASNARPMEQMDRPNCRRCQEEGRGDKPMRGNGTRTGKKQWICRTCDYQYTQLLRDPFPRGIAKGTTIKKPGPGHRRKDDLKGQRVDLLTDTLEKIVEAPARSVVLSEAIINGAEVLEEVKSNPI